MTTIDLGEIGSTPDPKIGAEFSHHLLRRAGVALALLLCLFGAAGSTRGGVPAIHPLWSVPSAEGDGTTIGTDTVYLQRTTAGRARLTAYDLATGAVRWETALDGTLGYTQLAEQAGLLLLPVDPEMADGRENERYGTYSQATTAIDIRTGAVRWTAPGEPMLVEGRTALMVDYVGDGTSYDRLRLIGLGPGGPRAIWSRDTRGVDSVAFALDGTRIEKAILMGRDGLTQVLRFADGALLAQAHLRWDPLDAQTGEYNNVAAAGDYLVVNRAREDQAELTVYRLDTLAEAWRITGTDRGYAFPCGTGICFNDGDNLTAYDSATGRMRWTRPGVGTWAAGPDRVVVELSAEGQMLIDAETGLPVGESGPGETVWTTDPGRFLLVLRATHEPPGSTAITRWDLATGRRDLLGAVGGLMVNRCQSIAHYLGCSQDQEFTVTAVG
ncbi:outer membrane protein assembly factor BamB family protein [Paractinoplanes toevensis]|uniref:Pyrrolo-quinoline quinone repeat domain-containing protein n=1 Tax=Paractinoplanes toevensis TaxID=571911 RepID=A0A919W0N6_9ACTN|nr:PQQ-binding-like beta-propeller repeat protein [Actinoplanes toevensis]GIM91502.1 hypothetical protein Ato02nite_032950 [Actinoplanes toevensis]